MRKNKKIAVVISIILILAIVGAVVAYLFVATDLFKSNEILFAKYILQSTETIQEITNFKTLGVYENLVNENKYESNTNAKMIHSEGGEVSNPLNNLTAKLEIQKNNEEQYVYADGQILYDDEEYLEAEIIREQDIYGIRFTDVVKQFITIQKDENTEDVASDIDLQASELETLINIVNGSEQVISNDLLTILKDKYLNIIIQELIKGTYERQRNAMITYNDITTKTNAYSVLLSSEQVENMLLEILNNVKDETEILNKLQIIFDEEIVKKIDEIISKINNELEVPTIKVTVYEQNQKTIRTVVEVGLYKVEMENAEQDGKKITKINYSDFNSEQLMKYNAEIIKQGAENEEKIEIAIEAVEGEENYTINISTQMQVLDGNIELDAEISHKQGITTKAIVLENDVNIGKDFDKTESLVLGNNILISSADGERRQILISKIKEMVSQVTNKRTELLKEKLGIKDEEIENSQLEDEETENTENEEGMSQVEINKFNAKFEFYTGDEVSAENVKTLLDIVKNNVSGHAIGDITIGTEEDAQTKSNITLYIEKDKTNEESITKALEKISDNKKYKVLISYKESNGLIDYITITEI